MPTNTPKNSKIFPEDEETTGAKMLNLAPTPLPGDD